MSHENAINMLPVNYRVKVHITSSVFKCWKGTTHHISIACFTAHLTDPTIDLIICTRNTSTETSNMD